MPGINGTDYTMRIFNSDGSEPEVIPNFLSGGSCNIAIVRLACFLHVVTVAYHVDALVLLPLFFGPKHVENVFCLIFFFFKNFGIHLG